MRIKTDTTAHVVEHEEKEFVRLASEDDDIASWFRNYPRPYEPFRLYDLQDYDSEELETCFRKTTS